MEAPGGLCRLDIGQLHGRRQRHRGRGTRKGATVAIAPLLKFWAVENKLSENLLVEKCFFFKNALFEVKTTIFGKFGRNIKILSTRDLLCRKIASSCPPTFYERLSHRNSVVCLSVCPSHQPKTAQARITKSSHLLPGKLRFWES